jgi:hypothetical protein
MQSGYARQYLFKDIFKVYLGGHLLSHLKLGVSESQHVLADLSPWLKKNGFLSLNGDHGAGTVKSCQSGGYRIYFRPVAAAKSKSRSGFSYLIRKTINTESNTLLKEMQTKEIYIETFINHTPSNGSVFLNDPYVRLINLSALVGVLVDKLAGMSAH